MSNSDFLSQQDRWAIAMNRVESLDYGTELIKPVVESFKGSGVDMIGIDDLEAFLDEMDNFN